MTRPVRTRVPAASVCPPPELQALLLRQATPDAEAFVVLQGVLEAGRAHLAHAADALRLTHRTARLGKEEVRPRLRAQCLGLPGGVGRGDGVDVHGRDRA